MLVKRLEKLKTGNRHVPGESVLAELYLEGLIRRCLNIEGNEDRCDIEEKGSHGEVSSGTNPGRRRGISDFSTVKRISRNVWELRLQNSYLLPEPKILSSGSLTEGSSFPSFRNRSGSNV